MRAPRSAQRIEGTGLDADSMASPPQSITGEPPPDRFCDLVIAGGVASGVVYPWAIVEIARCFRFRNLGGTSVGAVAAALAAASEYARCTKAAAPSFEVMRRIPLELADIVERRPGERMTRLLSLFDPHPRGERLFKIAVDAFEAGAGTSSTPGIAPWRDGPLDAAPADGTSRAPPDASWLDRLSGWLGHRAASVRAVVRWVGDFPVSFLAGRFESLVTTTLVGVQRTDASAPPRTNAGGDIDLGEQRAWAAVVRHVFRAYLPDTLRTAAVPLGATRWSLSIGLAGTVALSLLREPALTAGFAAVSIALAAWMFVLTLSWMVRGFRDAVEDDLRLGLLENGLGLCRGHSTSPDEIEAFTDWMHAGIQRSAGLRPSDAPLTFEDLWNAPRLAGEPPAVRAGAAAGPSAGRARTLNLEIVATNVTLGRPVLLPNLEAATKLYFLPEDWRPLFPESVMDWLERHAPRYAPSSPSDPSSERVRAQGLADLRQLPGADLPIVVAARMSLAVPYLFSTVPVWAVDFESAPRGKRSMRPCRITDGGVCSNFPIHMFDAAVPDWPTFGLWLSQQLQKPADDEAEAAAPGAAPAEPAAAAPHERAVWLPKTHLQGRADTWQRFEPATMLRNAMPAGCGAVDRDLDIGSLLRYSAALVWTMKDWSDRSRMQLPHVRDRIVRLALLPGEGQFNLAMPPQTILHMANDYGTRAGCELVRKFCSDDRGVPKPGWLDHQYVRLQSLLGAMRDLLDGLGEAADADAHALPLDRLLARAAAQRPLQPDPGRNVAEDPYGAKIDADDAQRLLECLDRLRELEPRLRDALEPIPYRPLPRPELRLRPRQ